MHFLKDLVFRAVFLLLLSSNALAVPMAINLCWDPNPEPDIAGYYIYASEEPDARNTHFERVFTMETEGQVQNLESSKTYHFQVTAINTVNLESDPSNEITYHMPKMTAPGKELIGGIWHYVFEFKRPVNRANQVYKVQSSTDLKSWIYPLNQTVESISIDDQNLELLKIYTPMIEREFFRIEITIKREGCAA